MNAYDQLGEIYDQFQKGRDQQLLEELAIVLQELPIPVPQVTLPEEIRTDLIAARPLALDLGCGSGRVTRFLLEKGWNVHGIDSSIEQIKRAEARAYSWEDEQWIAFEERLLEELGEDTYAVKRQQLRRYSFHLADLLDLAWAGTNADLALCWLDTFNHLPSEKWTAFCRIVNSGIRPGGYFIFDYLTAEYMEKYYAGRQYAENWHGQTLQWRNEYQPTTKSNIAHLQFSFGGQKKYCKIVETALAPTAVQKILANTGFEVVFNRPTNYQAERYLVCACKI